MGMATAAMVKGDLLGRAVVVETRRQAEAGRYVERASLGPRRTAGTLGDTCV